MDKERESNDQPGRNRDRPRGRTYQLLAADIAQPLAELQLPGANNDISAHNGTVTTADERDENAAERPQSAPEQMEGRNERRRTNPYQQLAADTAHLLTELPVTGASNSDGAVCSVDGKNESEIESHKEDKQDDVAKGKRKPRNHYVELAAHMSAPLAELRVPSTSEDRDLQVEAALQSQCQTNEPVFYQESLSEYDPNATCGSGSLLDGGSEEGEWSLRRHSEVMESSSFPRQESLAEYNPDATCGSTCIPSNTYGHVEVQTEREWTFRGQCEASGSVPYQESLSEYNPDATCGTGCWQEMRSEMMSFSGQPSLHTDYSSVQSDTDRICSKESSWIGESPKLPAETGSDGTPATGEDGKQQKDSYYSRQDGEPSTKRTKLNPEVRVHMNPEVTDKQLSLSSHPDLSYEETRCSGDSTFELGQGSIAEISSTEPERFTSMTTANIGQPELLNGGARLRDTENLSSEFEHMNIEEHNGVEPSNGSYCSVSSHTSNLDSFKSATELSSKVVENGSSYSDGFETPASNQAPAPALENLELASSVSGESLATVSICSHGARPKTNVKIPRGKKNKTPKQNTKNAYTELAKTVSGDLSALNRHMDGARSGDIKRGDRRTDVRDQLSFDGGRVHATGTNSTSDSVACSEFGQGGARQQPSEEQREDTSVLGDATQMLERNTCATSKHTDTASQGTHATSQSTRGSLQQTQTSRRRSRNSPGARAAAEYCRQQVQEQQKLIDNMGPELQAMVIEMMRRDEEELGGGHVLHGELLNPAVPPREQSVSYGASQQSGGKKSGKGKKKKGHYFELAGLIAPELAKVNGVLMNGHSEEQQQSTECAGADQIDGVKQGSRGHLPREENGPHHGTRHNGAYASYPRPSNQGVWGSSSCDQSHAQTSAPNRQSRGNGNHSLGGDANSLGSQRGRENQGQSSKQRKTKEEDKVKSSLSQMVENIAPSLHELNARLEEQEREQRERRSRNGVPDESVMRDTSNTPSHTPSANGYK